MAVSNKNVKALINANYACKQFLEYLSETYQDTFNEEELTNLKNMKDHLINLNVIFAKIKK